MKDRITVRKTYKLYIGGKFPRTESGRYDALKLGDGTMVNICRASRKDFRNAVVVARAAQPGWQERTAYNRGQILYRIAEMLEGRQAQFIAESQSMGKSRSQAEAEVSSAIDLLVYYAGWCDKYQQLFSSVNPVAAPYFNFSVPEPTGVVICVAHQKEGLLGLVAAMLPSIVGGNAIILLAEKASAISAISFAEVLQTSDVPGGVINILTGLLEELHEHFASHMDVNAIVVGNGTAAQFKNIQMLAANNVKRIIDRRDIACTSFAEEGPYPIMDTQEIKTTWHPVGK